MVRANRYLALISRTRHLKTTMRYHRNLLERLLSESHELTRVGERVEQREPSGTVGRTVTCAAAVENCMGTPQQVKNRAYV